MLQDGLVLSHWRRVADEGQTYPYSRFNKSVDVPTYTKEEYEVKRERVAKIKVVPYFNVATVFALTPQKLLVVSFRFNPLEAAS